jgi:hypothetical protein
VNNCDFKYTNAVPCGYCDKYGHAEKECSTNKRDESNAARFALEECQIDGLAACFSTENRSRTEVFLDSGASSHMTDQQWMLSNFTFETNSRWINAIGGARAAVLGKENIQIITSVNGARKKCTISDVLYAPSIGINFFSVGAVTEEGGEVHLTESHAFIERNGTLDMTANRTNNKLYRLDITVLRDNEAFIARPFQRSLQDWHQAIGNIITEKSSRWPIKRRCYVLNSQQALNLRPHAAMIALWARCIDSVSQRALQKPHISDHSFTATCAVQCK